MELQFKQKVTESLNKWLEESTENRSLNGLAEEHGITKLYVSRVKNGVYEIEQKTGQSTKIADEYFYRIAEAIGLMHRSHTGAHWETQNFKKVQGVCRAAQHKRLRALLEGDTGHGKTYGLDHYQIHNDKVIYIKVTRSMTERNLLDTILKKLGIREEIRGNRAKITAIRHALTGTPGYLLIIDEAEYLKPALFHVIKEIADFTEGKCGFILCGYGLVKMIKRLADRGRNGFPQLKRRFFPNRLLLPQHVENTEKRNICSQSGITDVTAVNVICQYCNDFDMLSKVIADVVAWQNSNNRKITGHQVMEMFKESFDID